MKFNELKGLVTCKQMITYQMFFFFFFVFLLLVTMLLKRKKKAKKENSWPNKNSSRFLLEENISTMFFLLLVVVLLLVFLGKNWFFQYLKVARAYDKVACPPNRLPFIGNLLSLPIDPYRKSKFFFLDNFSILFFLFSKNFRNA